MKNIKYSTELITSDLAHFVGFHDICPWNNDNDTLVIHQVEKDDIKYRTKDDYINIVLWNPKEKKVDVIDQTNCWNWQQGSRLQWVPKSDKIIYNKRVENKPIAQIFNSNEGAFEKTIDWPIYELHPSGKKALTYSFS